METQHLLDRIEIKPTILKGKTVIKGTRLSVQHMVGLLAQGISFEEILNEYQGLQKDDLLACLLFAANTLENNTFYPLLKSA